ncbi:hypothetical protein ONS95_005138 [Cadophora gregata]|uniref:uncharacterized protein n=1 Tax=Cadophora gregata TaxID=51156 RepID=UPI0026DA732B|nr:uncharacterized protein ONS95_005138 [Cadophora gregata]KAK0104872.1 hypothetical protein ONS95_005138 [Cadophora gregata]KAK0115049.1 hypothetical protein ONS96_013519 [Cadophora gregata f. sp. sojae]
MSGPRKGLVHQYTSRLTAFEHTPTTPPLPPQNILVFIGGLFDGLLTVPYTTPLAASLPPSWTLAQVHLSSSYTGWGTSNLQKDVAELSRCVKYFRGIKTGKIVLIGHSTGCQDIIEYLTGSGHASRAKIDGGILQGPVSDRQAIESGLDPALYSGSCAAAKAMVEAGDGDEILPSKTMKSFFGPAPVSAERWLSLASPDHDGDDDFFSSDLNDERLMKTFGALPRETPLCVLHSGSDEYVDPKLDKEGLIRRWIEIAKKGEGRIDEANSGILEGALHNLKGASEEVMDGFVKRVLGFLESLEGAQANL